MLLRMTLATITDEGVLLPLNKKKKTDPVVSRKSAGTFTLLGDSSS